MRHYLIAPVVALGMLTGSQLALAEQDPFVSMGLFFTPISEVDYSPGTKYDGNGFGARVEVGGSLHGYGEYSQSSLDDSTGIEQDFSDTRLGLAYRSHMDFGYVIAAAEYVSFDFDTAGDEKGVGVHLGLGFNPTDAVSLYGKVGMLALDNLDGPEIRIGAHANINEGTRVFAEYRTAMLSDAGLDVDVNDLRIGISFGF